MTVIGDVIKTIGAALEGLAQAQAATTEAIALATKAHGLAETVGGKGFLAQTRQIKDAVEAESQKMTVMVGNLALARQVAVAMADTKGRDARLKEAGTLLPPNLRSSNGNRWQRRRQQRRPVRRRRTGFWARNGFLVGQLGLLGWLVLTIVTDFPRWLDSTGIFLITSVNLWRQLKYQTVDGVPSRRSRREFRGGDLAVKHNKAKINRKLEQAVRRAFGAAVAGDGEELNDVVIEISWRGANVTDQAMDLVFAIGTATLLSIHHGDRPRDQQLRIMTRDFVDYESWAEVDFNTTLAYLKALADQTSPREALAVPGQMFAACAIGAWLLAAFIPDEVAWTDFLDGVLTKVESERADLLSGDDPGQGSSPESKSQ